MARRLLTHSAGSLIAALSGALVCASATAVEPNQTPAAATILPGGQLSIIDSLNGSLGRPDLLLGSFDPAYTLVGATDDNSSPLGNGFASQLTGIPLNPDGTVFFQVTGAPDTTFVGNHAQAGQYAWYLDVRDPDGLLVPALSQWQIDEISPLNRDNIWLEEMVSTDPESPNWEGYTADMTLNNVIGPGSGDALDYFTFTGLVPNQPFEARLTADFAGRLGLYDPTNALVASSNIFDAVPMLTGFADFLGRVKIGVTGAADSQFTGAHVEAGQFVLELRIVPEPDSGLLALAGLAMLSLWATGGRRIQSRGRSHTLC